MLWLVAAYGVIRLLHLWLLSEGLDGQIQTGPGTAAGTQGASLYETLGVWDGGWYLTIADDGYPDQLSLISVREDSTASLVFPPLYPLAMRALGLLGLPTLAAGLLLSALAGLAAVVGVYAVARDLLSRSAAWLTAVLWAAGPMTIVLTMAYSEALFVALAAWALWFLRREWWLTAGLLGLLGGLTRSTGLAVGAALVTAAVLTIRRGHASGRSQRRLPAPVVPDDDLPGVDADRVGRHGAWRPMVGAGLAVIGVPLWWVYVAVVSGRVDGWFAAQEFFWGSRFDFGASVLRNGWRMLAFEGRFDPMTRFVYTLSFFAMVVAIALLFALVAHVSRSRQLVAAVTGWWPVATYAAVLVVLAVGSAGYPHSKMRFLVPMFPLLLLPAARIARLGRGAQATIVGVLAVTTGWLGAYMLTVWPYAI